MNISICNIYLHTIKNSSHFLWFVLRFGKQNMETGERKGRIELCEINYCNVLATVKQPIEL